jgi:hypothetical protein
MLSLNQTMHLVPCSSNWTVMLYSRQQQVTASQPEAFFELLLWLVMLQCSACQPGQTKPTAATLRTALVLLQITATSALTKLARRGETADNPATIAC